MNEASCPNFQPRAHAASHWFDNPYVRFQNFDMTGHGLRRLIDFELQISPVPTSEEECNLYKFSVFGKIR